MLGAGIFCPSLTASLVEHDIASDGQRNYLAHYSVATDCGDQTGTARKASDFGCNSVLLSHTQGSG